MSKLEKLYFQDVGGTEILSVARHDTIGGEEVAISHVDNIKDIRVNFNPLNILMSTELQTLFSKYAIDIKQKVGSIADTFVMDESNNLVVNVENINSDEYVQIQVSKNADEFELGDSGARIWYNWKEEK